MSSNEIIITGYPKSGNTWTARLLADALDSPLTGKFTAVPIGQEGLDRTGDYTVIQLHLVPNCDNANGQFIPNRFHVCPEFWNGEKIVILVRDPRDVVVSAQAYWEIASISQTITAMATVEWPMSSTIAWHQFIAAWKAVELPVVWVKYEAMVNDPLGTLTKLLVELGAEPVNDLAAVIERQSLEKRRLQFEGLQGHWHPYGAGIQLKNLRKGIVGDWRNHFTREDARLLHGYFFETMQELGYEDDEGWYDSLK